MRLATSGRALASPLRGGANTSTDLNGAGRKPERAVAVALRVVELGVVVVEEEQVFALHVEDQRVGVGRVVAEHARVEQRVEQEGCVRRLGRDTRDAGDVDVRAARPVDEVEVGEQRVAVAAEADRELRSIRSKNRAWSRFAPVARCTSAPGCGGTYTSGSTRVVVISAASTASAGSNPSVMRNTSESKRAPSCRARTLVTTPESRTGSSRPGTARSHTTTSSSWRYWSSASATQKVSGVASSVPRTRPTGGFLMRATVVPGCDRNGGSSEPPPAGDKMGGWRRLTRVWMPRRRPRTPGGDRADRARTSVRSDPVRRLVGKRWSGAARRRGGRTGCGPSGARSALGSSDDDNPRAERADPGYIPSM